MKNLYYKHVAGRTAGTAGVGCLVLICVFVLVAMWTDRNLDFWLTHFKGQAVNCPWWLSTLVTVFLPALIVLNIVGEIARLLV